MSREQSSRQAKAKASPLTDDLLEAFLDTRVIEALGKALSPAISKCVEDAMAPFVQRLENLTAQVRELKADNTRFNTQLESVANENVRLKKLLDESNRRLDDLDSYSRCDNLIIRGLPERTASERASDAPALNDGAPSLRENFEAVESTVLEFFNNKLGVRVGPQDISVAHRLKATERDKVRPVIMRFLSRKVRNAVYRAKKQLRDTNQGVYISEHLTKTASDFFFSARKLLKEKKIFGTWTQNGQVYVKFAPEPNAKGKIIKCQADLNLLP